MIVLIIAGGWLVGAAVAAVVIGRGIHHADLQELRRHR